MSVIICEECSKKTSHIECILPGPGANPKCQICGKLINTRKDKFSIHREKDLERNGIKFNQEKPDDSDVNLTRDAFLVPQLMHKEGDKPKECIRCSHCCRTLIKVYINNPAVKEFCAAREFEIVDENSKMLLVSIPHVCPKLEKVKGQWSCRLHSIGKKPRACRLSPEASLPGDDQRFCGLDIRRSLGENCPWRKA